jgi:hypothetical protein
MMMILLLPCLRLLAGRFHEEQGHKPANSEQKTPLPRQRIREETEASAFVSNCHQIIGVFDVFEREHP